MTARGITVIGASAGSGKTYRLTKEVTDALVDPRQRIDVTSLVAVTFTRKAHTELEARIRQKLVSIGAYEDALRLPLAYVGTVHAVALRLLQEFAIDAGLSPSVDVIAGNETKLLRQAFERTLDEPTRARLDELAARVELRLDARAGRTDWLSPCADIMDLARSNRIPPSELPSMAQRSIDGLSRLLPPPVRDGLELDENLAAELETALRRLEESNDGKQNTAAAIDLIRTSIHKLRDSELRWSGWAKLAAISPSRECEACVTALKLAAARYEEHPRLHGDLRAVTQALFDAARAGLVAYQAWKRERHVVDYVDMLDGALTLLDTQHVRAELCDRLKLVVVDEFQDTSPIQLALFLRIHEMAGESIWVGDRKQCIFEYAGADPMLMDAVSAWVEREGGYRDRLENNHRSRPELVEMCSELFALSLAPHGFTREEVVVAPKRSVPPLIANLPPLGLWRLGGRNKQDDAQTIADGIKRMLDTPNETPVVDRVTGDVRGVRPGDIAVLATTNEWAAQLAMALHERGIRAATARAGLFDTPEGTLIDAALRWLIDAHDELAAANIDALTGWNGQSEDAWLTARVRAKADTSATPELESHWRPKLAPIRERLSWLSPSEVLDLSSQALDLVQLCARWPDAPLRIANIDSLRSIAENYEERCAQEREAATVAGLLRYFDDVRSPVLQRDEVLPSDDQHVPTDDGAVVVCTYHKSKGLEWPVVILANLDRRERRDAFEVTPESDNTDFDPVRPLANRSIRYWPWPFGALEKVPLRERAEQSTEGRAVSQREERERARLLYVGFTRARDHLVLAIRVSKGKPNCPWLDSLNESGHLKLPVTTHDDTSPTLVGSLCILTRIWTLASNSQQQAVANEERSWFVRTKPLRAGTASYRINPSREIAGWPAHELRLTQMKVGRIERFESGIALRGRPAAYDDLGHAVHAFLAADTTGLDARERLERAERLIAGWGMGLHVEASELVRAGDALRRWVSERWPRAVWHREISIEGAVPSTEGERWVSGIIDLLLEVPEGYVLVDHKSFPAPHEAAWRAKCETFIPQIAAYELMIEATEPKRVLESWIHLPMGGGMVNIRSGRV